MATGLTQRALHGRVIHPTGKGIAFFLQLVKVGFHLRDTEGDFFGADAEVHSAQLIQLVSVKPPPPVLLVPGSLA